MPDITLDGDSPDEVTIDGQQVNEVTIDGDVAWEIITDGLLLRYRFEENGGTVIEDWTSQNNDGSTSGGPTWVTDNSEGTYALDFDGTDDYTFTPAGFLPDTMTDITITMSYKATDNGKNDSIFQLTPDETDRLNCHLPWGDGTIFWDFGDISNGGRITSSWQSSYDNTWATWAFTASIGSHMEIFRDGVSLARQTTTDPSGIDTSDKNNFQIGIDGSHTDATVDDFRIYNRVLSDVELQQIADGEG